MSGVIEIGTFNGETSGFVGSTNSAFGLPASNISINGGGQIQTITKWNEEGYEVPVYAYVVAGIPQAQLTAEAGISEKDPGGCWAEFIDINQGVVRVEVTGVIPDPTQAKSTGGSSQFTWLVPDADPNNPYSTVQ